MIIGVPKEVKTKENRVGIVPGGVGVLVKAGHTVLIQKGAGVGAGITDEKYIEAGARILGTADEIWREAEMVMKVKEPIAEEFSRMRSGQLLYTYLHLAAEPTLTRELMQRNVSAVAYETIELADRSLPLLTPMSEVAGRMSIQVGAKCLEKHNGGKGLLLGGVPGVKRGRVAIIGGGVVGINAAKMAVGLGAQVTILDINPQRLAYLDDIFGGRVNTVMSNSYWVNKLVVDTDLLIGAVLIPGAKAPHIVTEDMVKRMKPGSVVIDVAIDQGGCIETCDMPTTHSNPIVEKYGVIHYSVANIPGAVPRTSTLALTNVTLPYVIKLANQGLIPAVNADPSLAKGMNTYAGKIVHEVVARSLKMTYTDLLQLI